MYDEVNDIDRIYPSRWRSAARADLLFYLTGAVMLSEIVNYGPYAYRAYAKKRDQHGVIWDAYFDLLDGRDGRLLHGENVVRTDDVLTTPESACRLAEVFARASIEKAMADAKQLTASDQT